VQGITRVTIIAVRDGIIAADSRLSVDGILTRCQKLFVVPDGIIGFAGATGPGQELLHWLQNHSCTEPVKTDEYHRADLGAILLTRKGIYCYDNSLSPDLIEADYFAVGTAAQGAMCAMDMGAGAIQAARIACKHDMNCGPPIRWKKLK
jgi:ATP-dependent protease HslVU (ClpYQ) peptidase subunit